MTGKIIIIQPKTGVATEWAPLNMFAYDYRGNVRLPTAEAIWQRVEPGVSIVIENPGTEEWRKWYNPMEQRLVPIWQGIASAPYGLRLWLSYDSEPSASPKALDALVDHEIKNMTPDSSRILLSNLARNSMLSDASFDKLADASMSSVSLLLYLAKNTAAPKHILLKVRDRAADWKELDTALDASKSLATKWNLDEKTAMELATHKDVSVRMNLAKNRKIPRKALDKLMKDRSSKVKEIALAHELNWFR